MKTNHTIRTYTVREVGNMLGVCDETIRRWIRDGKLEGMSKPVGRGIIVSEEALMSFVSSKNVLLSEKTLRNASCWRCLYFHEDESEGDFGECRRYPRKPFEYDGELYWSYPEMECLDWCGEFIESPALDYRTKNGGEWPWHDELLKK